MKKILLMLALAGGVASAHAQSADTTAVNDLTLKADIYPQQEDGDLYHGLSRKLTFDRMIPPYGLEVTYDKTTHIIFPSAVRYVDLGSPNLIAGKADGSENVIRVKATRKNFREETNMSVITESGSFYTFNVKYADEPLLLNIEMADFVHDGSEVNRPNNALDIYLKELGSESPKLVYLIAKAIHKDNRRHIKHIGSKAFGIQYLLRGLYTHNGLLYFHTQVQLTIDGQPYEVDIVMAENGNCSILHNGNSFNAGLVRGEGGKNYDVNILTRSFHVDIVDTQAKYLHTRKGADEKQDNKIVAPMPGKVVSIPVKVGDRLAAGDIAIVLEAMKMQSNYKVSADCVVRNILVSEGEAVNANQTLIELEIIKEED